MARTGHVNQKTQGEAILERLSASPHAKALKKDVAAFRVVHETYLDACAAAARALEHYDDARNAVALADNVLDDLVLRLADVLVGAKLGKRVNPFAAYAKHPPQAMTKLAYTTEVDAVREMVKAIHKVKPNAEVRGLLQKMVTAADTVTARLRACNAPKAAYEEEMRRRDDVLMAWHRELQRLKRVAAVAFDDDTKGFRAAFAPPDRLQAPIAKRPRKPRTTPAATPPAK